MAVSFAGNTMAGRIRVLVMIIKRCASIARQLSGRTLVYSRAFASCLHQLLAYRISLVWIQLSYFTFLSLLGFLALRSLAPDQRMRYPEDLDLFFMSASAATVSSMSTVEMEALSSSQLVLIALLMLFGSEVFTSLLELQIIKWKVDQTTENLNIKKAIRNLNNSTESQIESGVMELPDSRFFKSTHALQTEQVRKDSLQILSTVILGFLLLSHFIGSASIMAYLSFIPSAGDVIKKKGFTALTFSIFMTISSFANGGFVPINENMIPFKKHSGMLTMVIPLILIGNTLFPACLRLIIKIMKRFNKREEFAYLLEGDEQMGFHHLFSDRHSIMLVLTVTGLLAVQTMFFCFMEWNSSPLHDLKPFQKFVGALFQSVNARHAGESIFDMSLLSPAILVSYVIMMYLPSYTSFLLTTEERCTTTKATEEKKSLRLAKSFLMSQLSYVAIAVILVCITERKKLIEDPLNFNVLNIVLEVISAYGNVGFSTGYSCERQLKPDTNCTVKWYGFVGTWSNGGKVILIFVMFFGRLKKFNRNGGKAWKLG